MNSVATQTSRDEQNQTTAATGTHTDAGTGTSTSPTPSPTRSGQLERENIKLQRENNSLRGEVARLRRAHEDSRKDQKTLDDVLTIVTRIDESCSRSQSEPRQTEAVSPMTSTSTSTILSYEEKRACDTVQCHKCPWYEAQYHHICIKDSNDDDDRTADRGSQTELKKEDPATGKDLKDPEPEDKNGRVPIDRTVLRDSDTLPQLGTAGDQVLTHQAKLLAEFREFDLEAEQTKCTGKDHKAVLEKSSRERDASGEQIQAQALRTLRKEGRLLTPTYFRMWCKSIVRFFKEEHKRNRRHLRDFSEQDIAASSNCLPANGETVKPDEDGGKGPKPKDDDEDDKRPSDGARKPDSQDNTKTSSGNEPKPKPEDEPKPKPKEASHAASDNLIDGAGESKNPDSPEALAADPQNKQLPATATSPPRPSMPLPFTEAPPDALKVYESARGHEFVPVPTNGDGMLCGVNAIQNSVENLHLELQGLTAATLLEVLDLEDYQSILLDDRFIYLDDHGKEVKPDNRLFFAIDQLETMVGLWGYHHGRLDLRVGLLRNDHAPSVHGGLRDGPTTIIWIHHDNNDERSAAQGVLCGQEDFFVDHYSGVKREPRDTEDKALAKKRNQEREASEKAALEKQAVNELKAVADQNDVDKTRATNEKTAADERAAADKKAANEKPAADATKTAEEEAALDERAADAKEAADTNAKKAADERRASDENKAAEQKPQTRMLPNKRQKTKRGEMQRKKLDDSLTSRPGESRKRVEGKTMKSRSKNEKPRRLLPTESWTSGWEMLLRQRRTS